MSNHSALENKNKQLKRIAFVILHFGDSEVTDCCVRSIFRMEGFRDGGLKEESKEKTKQDSRLTEDTGLGPDVKIVIVDNDHLLSKSEREVFASRYADQDRVTVITAPEGSGFSRANNIGYAYAREQLSADCIIVCNNDIEFVQPDFIGRLTRSVRRMNCHVLGPNVIKKSTHEPQNPIDTRLRTQEEAAYTVRMNRAMLRVLPLAYPFLKLQLAGAKRAELNKKKAEKAFYKEPHKHIVPFGACLIFTPLFVENEKQAFEPETNFYYEEYILANRCFGKGYETGYDPSLKVLHESGSATKSSLRSEYRRTKHLLKNTADSCSIYVGCIE